MQTGLQAEVLMRLRREGGGGLLGQLAALLARTAPARLAQIAHALASGDRVAMARAAHSLSASAANLGANALAAAAVELERAAAEGPWPAAAAPAADRTQAAWQEIAGEVRRLAAAAPSEDPT